MCKIPGVFVVVVVELDCVVGTVVFSVVDGRLVVSTVDSAPASSHQVVEGVSCWTVVVVVSENK